MAEIVKYLWDFGDGETSTEKNPQHNYMEGVWTVSLTYWDSNGTQHYEPKYDYIVVTPLDWTKEYNPSLPDTCYWSPVKGGQGLGVSEFNGDNWIWPACFNSVCYGYDDERNKLLLCVDETSQAVHQLNVTDIWKDKEEYEIGSEIHFPSNMSHKGPWTHIRHEETRMQLDPFYKDARDETKNGQVFDNDGFPDGMTVDVLAYIDRINSPATAKAIEVSKDGDIVFHQQLEGREIRRHISLDRAPYYFSALTGVFTFEDKNTPGAGVSELDMQQNILSDPYYWFSRTYAPMYNLVQKHVAEGYVTISDLTEGPDGRSDSAMRMPNASGITDTFISDVSTATVIAWTNGFPDDGDEGYILTTTDHAITVKEESGVITVTLYGLTVFNVLPRSFEKHDVDWHNFIICLDPVSGSLKIYYNGLKQVDSSMPIILSISEGQEFTVYWGFHDGLSVSENKMIPAILTTREALYYYQDCVQRSGTGVLPL